MNVCPTCNRPHRARRMKARNPQPWENSPLGAWRPSPPAQRPEPRGRLVILHECLNAEGEPRGGIVRRGSPTLAYDSLAAAAFALREMEAPK